MLKILCFSLLEPRKINSLPVNSIRLKVPFVAMAIASILLLPALANAAIINVKDYGAVGNNKADDTLAVQNALNAAHNNTVYFPGGQYKITRPLTVPQEVNLLGDGNNFSTEIVPTDCDGIYIDGDALPGGYAFRNKLEGLTIHMVNTTSDATKNYTAIKMNKAYTITFANLFVFNARNIGNNNNNPAGISISNSRDIRVRDVSVYGQSSGIGVLIADSEVNIFNIDVEAFAHGIKISDKAPESGNVNIFGAHIERFGGFGILFQGSSYNSVTGARIAGVNSGTIPIGFKDGEAPFLNGVQSRSEYNTIASSYLITSATDLTNIKPLAQLNMSSNNTLFNTLVHGKPTCANATKLYSLPIANLYCQ